MIWLIGNKGMLGTEVEELLKKQHKNYVASDQEIDITNMECLQEFAQAKPISWIINCAAYNAVDKAEEERETAFRINAEGPLHLARVAAGKNARLLHLSTDYVFDGTKEDGYVEEDLPNPLSVYGASKYRGETNIAANLKAHFLIRTAWLYGKKGPNFVHTMLRLFKENAEVRVVADQWGSPTAAVDLAAAILQIINSDSNDYGVYHFSNAGRINWYEFAVAIYDLARKRGLLEKTVQIIPIATEQYPTKAKRPQYSYLSKEKICRNFSITLKPWQESLATFIGTLSP